MFWKILEKKYENLGKILRNLWTTGTTPENLRKSCKTQNKIFRNFREHIGKPLEKCWEIFGKTWKP
jgi:hypothetical protein